jgi:hypothetical protein
MMSRWILPWVLTSILVLPLLSQSVISARSGLIHLADGAVLLDNQRLEPRFGKYDQMKEGSELRTESGRAEVLLTPGVFLRLGQESAIRMISNRLSDTRVEFLRGSAVVESGAASQNTSVTILFSDHQVHIRQQGRYRFDSEPPEFTVESGQADVLMGAGSVSVQAGDVVSLSGPLVIPKLASERADALESWNKMRDNSIAEDNLAAAGTSDLSTVIDGWQDDPDALLRAIGTSGYIPQFSSRMPLSTYSPLSTYTPLSTYSPLITSPGLGGAPFGIWGLGFGNPFGVYRSPMIRYYPYPAVGGSAYRPPLTPARPVIGSTSAYRMAPPGQVRPVTPIHSVPGRVGGGRR